ncbi:MAG: hypothetical protein ACFCGT_03560 [Sandaracinaceae bacterium]
MRIVRRLALLVLPLALAACASSATGGTASSGPAGESGAETPESAFVCGLDACAEASSFDGAWLCQTESESRLVVERGAVRFYRPGDDEPYGHGCMTCEGLWEASAVDGTWVNVNGRLGEGGGLAWEWCTGVSLEECRERGGRASGVFDCARQ